MKNDTEDVTLVGAKFSKSNQKHTKDLNNGKKPQTHLANNIIGGEKTKFTEANKILNDDIEDEIEVFLIRRLYILTHMVDRETLLVLKRNSTICRV